MLFALKFKLTCVLYGYFLLCSINALCNIFEVGNE